MNIVEETLRALSASKREVVESLQKAWVQPASATSGLAAYDLEAPAKTLYPVITPLRNRIPRVGGGTGIQANWRAITGVNINGMAAGVGEGNRSGVIATTTANYFAAFRSLGLEDYVTFEADSASQGFDDVKARAVEGLLRSLFIQQERILLGANSSTGLGTTPTPSLTAIASGGSIPTGTAVYVICVALTLEGYLNGTVAGGIPGGLITRTNADGSTDTYGGGTAKQSAASNVTTAANNSSVQASVTDVAGAVAYAWLWGATAAAATLGAITTINSVLITTAAGTGTQTTSSAGVNWGTDYSQNTLEYDGLLSMSTVVPGSNSYFSSQATGTPGAGTPLTADGEGGIVEIDTALKSFWDNYRLSPTDIYVNSQEQMNISKKILQGSANTAQRFTFNVDQGVIAGGIMVRSYLNKFSMGGATELPIHLHPNMPPGTILFYSDKLPYPLSNVTNVLQVRMRRGYYQLEWPLRSRKYEYGVYSDEVLQNYFPPAFGVINNIANG